MSQMCSTTSYTYSSGNTLGEKDEERWTTAKIIDEFITALSLAYALIVNREFGHTLIIPKYYERAAYLMYRIHSGGSGVVDNRRDVTCLSVL
jgi:hypothetical protein